MRDLTVFREQLEARLSELMEHLNQDRLARTEERERRTQREVTDTKDTAFRDAVAELAELGLRREAEELTDIHNALGRLQAGRYGVCIECDDEIPQERLMAWPTAKRCRPCQADYETRREGGHTRA